MRNENRLYNLRTAIATRLNHICASQNHHERRDELCEAVFDSLDNIKSGNGSKNKFEMLDFVQIRNDGCLIKPNDIMLERTSDKTPYLRSFSYIDFAVTFSSKNYYAGFSSHEQFFGFLKTHFYDELYKQLCDYFKTDNTVILSPTNVSRSKLCRISKNKPNSNSENLRFVLSEQSRSVLSSKSPGKGKPAVFKENLNIPDGILVIHLDQWMKLDETGKENLGFFDFGIRIWPKIFGEIRSSKLTLVSKITEIETNRSDVYKSVFGFDENFFDRKKSASGVISEFVLIWKWLRHHYQELSCLTDWFLVNFSLNCCFENDEKCDWSYRPAPIEKSFRKSLRLINSGIFLENSWELYSDPVGGIPIQYELYKSNSDISSVRTVQKFSKICLELLNLDGEELIFGKNGSIQTELSKSLTDNARHLRFNNYRVKLKEDSFDKNDMIVLE